MLKVLGLVIFFAGLNFAHADNWAFSNCEMSASSGPNFRHCHLISLDGPSPQWTGLTGDVKTTALTCGQMSDPNDKLCTEPAVLCKIWKKDNPNIVCNQVVPGTTNPEVCKAVAKCKNETTCNVGWCFEYSQGDWEVGN